jgi:large conductance mechanosensitive channel
MPPISVLLPIRKNIQEKFAVLQGGDNYDSEKGYNTPGQALEDGAVIMTYGLVHLQYLPWDTADKYRAFIYQCVSFLMVGVSLYGLANLFQTISSEPIIKHTKKCKYCRKRINEKVCKPPNTHMATSTDIYCLRHLAASIAAAGKTVVRTALRTKKRRECIRVTAIV